MNVKYECETTSGEGSRGLEMETQLSRKVWRCGKSFHVDQRRFDPGGIL